MKVNRILALFLVCTLFFTTSTAMVSAASTSEDTEQHILTQQEINKLNAYVSLDTKLNQFTIDKNAKKDLTKEEFSKLKSNIEQTNSVIESMDKTQVNLIDPKNEKINATYALSFNEGVTKVDFYWWGARVYLSKSTLQTIGGGIAIGGIWIPEPLVSKIIATLGAVTALAPGGIVFDINLWIAGLDLLTPGLMIPFSAISNIHWQ